MASLPHTSKGLVHCNDTFVARNGFFQLNSGCPYCFTRHLGLFTYTKFVKMLNPISIDLFGALWYLEGGHDVPTDIKTPVKPQVSVQIR